MEILPDVHSIPWGQSTHPGTFPPNVFLIAGEKAALVDSGYPEEASVKARLDYIKDFSLGYIFITHNHFDHIGGAPAIKQATQAHILAHPQEQAPVDRQVSDGERISLGPWEVEIVHTPGHTPGHICLWLEAKKALFTGDHILGLGTNVVWDMSSYLDSLRKLMKFPAEILCPGHGPVVRQAQAKIKELIRHRQEREEQVLACLKQGLRDIPSLVKAIYPELAENLVNTAGRQLQSHLDKLVKEGRVREEAGQYSPR